MSLINLKNIYVTYGKKEGLVTALNDLNLVIEEGDFAVITGKSGCGKTTCLNIIGGIKTPTSGKYFFDKVDASNMSNKEAAAFRNKNIGFVVQQFALIPERTVRENIEIPLIYRGDKKKVRREKIQRVLELLELGDKGDSVPYELSGGQKQRVAIARAIVTEPRVVIADEPTGALDEKTGKMIVDILKDINKRGTTVVMVTHDKELADMGNRRIVIRDGRVSMQ